MKRSFHVLGSSIILNILVKGSLKSLGIFLLELRKQQNIDPSLSAWIPAIAYTLFALLSSPVAWLRDRWSSRAVCLVGSIFVSSGFLLAYMPTLPALYIGLGVLLGSGGCMVTISGSLEINRMFKSGKLGMAHGLSLAGNTAGGLVVPAILAFLMEDWGYKGSILLHTGLLLHTIPASLFFSSERTGKKSKTETEVKKENVDEKESTQSVFSNPKFWCFIWGQASTTIGYTNFGLYLPLHLNSVLDYSGKEAAIFLSVFSFGDFVGRISGPSISDKTGFRWAWYCGGLILAGIMMLAMAFKVNLFLISVYTVVAGVGSGIMVGIYPALLSDELGADQLSHTYPASITVAGLLNLAGPPILAQVSEMVSSYAVMFVMGVSLILGALPLLMLMLIHTFRRE